MQYLAWSFCCVHWLDTVLSQCLSGGTQEYKWVPVKGVLTCSGTESHPGGSSTHSYFML